MDYDQFVASKLAVHVPTGIPDAQVGVGHLFEHQRLLTQWALRRGRAAIFAAMGLGKSRCELTWAQHVVEHTGKPVLILTPLAVAQQMLAEAIRIGVDASLVRERDDVASGINICNYERLSRLDASVFGGVVCDESGCIKGLGSKTLAQLLEAFGETPFRLAATATPAPNDYVELTQHCELLSIGKRFEILAEYFVRDNGSTQDWILKGHARQLWWRFVSTWGALVRSPADLGLDGSAYELPPLEKHVHMIPADENVVRGAGMLFAEPARTLMARRQARRASLGVRVERTAELVNGDSERWVVWSDLNDESTALSKLIMGSVEVTGSMSLDEKESALQRFLDGSARVLVTKPSIAGHGLNMQFCSRTAFCGISDSWEQQHQAIGRFHRFGQREPVQVHYFLSEMESAVLDNIKRKEADASAMGEELSRETRELVRAEVLGAQAMTRDYEPRMKMRVPKWLKGDAA